MAKAQDIGPLIQMNRIHMMICQMEGLMSKGATRLIATAIIFSGSFSAFGAAAVQVTGPDLAKLLYGHEDVGKLTNGTKFDVSYDAVGTQFAGGKKTGSIVTASDTQWCMTTGGKKDYCVTVYKTGKTSYSAKYEDGSAASTFTVK